MTYIFYQKNLKNEEENNEMVKLVSQKAQGRTENKLQDQSLVQKYRTLTTTTSVSMCWISSIFPMPVCWASSVLPMSVCWISSVLPMSVCWISSVLPMSVFLNTLFQNTLLHRILSIDILQRKKERFIVKRPTDRLQTHDCSSEVSELSHRETPSPWNSESIHRRLLKSCHWIQDFQGHSCYHCSLWRREDSDDCISWESGSIAQDLCAAGLQKGQKVHAMCWLGMLPVGLISVFTLGRMTNIAL